MIENFGRMYLLVGPIIIISIGILITTVYVSQWTGIKRAVTLLVGPLLTLLVTLGVTYFVTNVLKPAEGSGFLLGGVVIMLYFLCLLVYYPILLIVLLINYIKSKKTSPAAK